MSEEKKKKEPEKDNTEVPVKKTSRQGRKASPKKKDKKEEKIQELGEKLEEMNDKYLRLFSEFDNFRKRTQKEKLELFKTASEDVIVALLPVIDDFERALKVTEENDVDEEHREGIELIYNKLTSKGKNKEKDLEDLKDDDAEEELV